MPTMQVTTPSQSQPTAAPDHQRSADLQPQGNAVAQDDLAQSSMPAVDLDIGKNRARLGTAKQHMGDLFGFALEDLRSGLKEQAKEVLSRSPDTSAAMFGEGAAMALALLLGPVGKAAGPVVGYLAGRLKARWSADAKKAFSQVGAPGQLFDADEFLAAYHESWTQAVFEETDSALASDDPAHVAQVTAAALYVAYHPAETRSAFKLGMLLPLLRAADGSGAGRTGPDRRLNGVYNLRIVYQMRPEGLFDGLTTVALPTGVPDEDREALIELSGLLEEVPCQLISADGRVIADVSPYGRATPRHIDPTVRPLLERLGSDRSQHELDILRYKAMNVPSGEQRDNARAILNTYVAEACDRIWDSVLEQAGANSLSDLQQDGITVLGAS